MRYYPKNKVKTGLYTSGGEFSLNGAPYVGYYYVTYDGKYFTGFNPSAQDSQSLVRDFNVIRSIAAPSAKNYTESGPINRGEPTSYFPNPTESDYNKGFILRYFVKKTYQKGYIKEISESEYASIENGSASYDISFYHTLKLFWKLTGPLRSKRISQYNTREGIIDTNKRLVESSERNFQGIVAYIAEEYDKFSRVTE